jgi:hypothetical protein
MMEYLYLQRYRLPSSVARDTVIKDCIPLGYVVDSIVLINGKPNEVTVTVNINDDSSIPMVRVPANGATVVTPNERYYASVSAFVEITSTNWNNARLGMQIVLWKV